MSDVVKDPFLFAYGDGQPDRKTAVFQALGAASTCWTDLRSAGVFDSERCKEIGETLVDELRRLDEPLLGLATTRQLLDELRARLVDHTRYSTAGGITNDGHSDPRVRYTAELIVASIDDLGLTGPADVLEYRTVDS